MSKYYESLKSYFRILRASVKKTNYSIFGNDDYKKFIIITHARTGSNLLMSYLDSHNRIEAKGELFRNLQGKSSLELWNNFFSKKNKKVNNVGFKLFYSHPFHTTDRDVWKFILEDPDIRIIHLVRENKLRLYVSSLIARKTSKWTRKSNNKISLAEKQIEIDFDSFCSRLDKIREYENQTRINFKNHQFLEISYEELVSDKKNTMSRVFEFLQVKTSKFKSDYKKQNSETLRDLILNYDEFVERINETEYSYLLSLENQNYKAD